MEDVEWIKWWKYPSVWVFMGILIGTFTLCLLSALFIPEFWNLGIIVVLCAVGGFFGRKYGMNALHDIFKNEF